MSTLDMNNLLTRLLDKVADLGAEADIIANESEPRTWTTLFDLFSFYSQYANQGKFYTNFYIQPIEKDNLYPLFRSSNYNLISLLTRTNEAQKDYQEETYLDMFIYRTGRKYNKRNRKSGDKL